VFAQGSIPGSKNLAFTHLLNADKTFKSPEELKTIFKAAGILNPESDQLIVSCQRGITACIVDAGLRIVGNKNTSIYDGSYEEFAYMQKKEKEGAL
jgi:thiosulfate/3-mercaptopyruvate sulfurtransferase